MFVCFAIQTGHFCVIRKCKSVRIHAFSLLHFVQYWIKNSGHRQFFTYKKLKKLMPIIHFCLICWHAFGFVLILTSGIGPTSDCDVIGATYRISSYKALPRIIPAFLIMSAPGTFLCRWNLVISNNTRS